MVLQQTPDTPTSGTCTPFFLLGMAVGSKKQKQKVQPLYPICSDICFDQNQFCLEKDMKLSEKRLISGSIFKFCTG